ncbi:unnamed protein product [Spirodela intermedia]|uniref:Uncharacterized protein n=1 Tax=Spirodela intermedia TaxID=51605 RepID=A0A7I8JNU3_SPIIN|nr:unnamed protein product [Spirodela intermedia]CAA6671441.1 unnamed protein product [Spirodela intermedia]
MRGRLWGWWIVQTLGGVLCIWLGKTSSLSLAIFVMIVFSVFVQAACGLAFGVVPSSPGAALLQGTRYTKEDGITYMGIMILCCTLPIMLIYFPMWGGMLFGPSSKEDATEENYYAAEWSAEEKARGLHLNTIKFAENSKGERGRRRRLAPTTDATPSHV